MDVDDQKVNSYCYSRNGEHYEGSEPTREAAYAEALGSLCLTTGDAFTTARVVPIDWTNHAWAERVVEDIAEQASEQTHDYADDPHFEPAATLVEELDGELRAVVAAWIARHGLAPDLYAVTDVVEHVAAFPEASRG